MPVETIHPIDAENFEISCHSRFQQLIDFLKTKVSINYFEYSADFMSVSTYNFKWNEIILLVKKLTSKSSIRHRQFYGIRIGTLNERGKDRMNNEIRLFSTGVMILILLLGVAAYFSVGYVVS